MPQALYSIYYKFTYIFFPKLSWQPERNYLYFSPHISILFPRVIYWDASCVIHNVASLQMNHVGSKSSSEEMFSALLVTHKNKAHQTVNHIQCLLYETRLLNADDLLKHLDCQTDELYTDWTLLSNDSHQWPSWISLGIFSPACHLFL